MIKDLYYKTHKFIFLKILGRKIIFNCNKYCKKTIGNALLYYKIDPFLNPNTAKKYRHTNYQEILEIVKILNTFGYNTDIIDRSMKKSDITKLKLEYDLIIGLGVGNSGKYFADIMRKYPNAIKVLYAAGPEPNISNKLIKERYEYFEKRHPHIKMKLRRMITKFDFKNFVELTDIFLVVGNEFSINTYKQYNKPIFPILPSSHPGIFFDNKISDKKQKRFLYFGGNGNIVKGLDLLLEIFCDLPELDLYICAPKTENDFNQFYKKTIDTAKNIHIVGFVEPGGQRFNHITEKCGYVILPSCSEGIATSVVTCMRRGLIPIVSYEAGIDTKDFGFLINDIRIEELKKQIVSISNIKHDDFIERTEKTYINSKRYTITGFVDSFYLAISKMLSDKATSNV